MLQLNQDGVKKKIGTKVLYECSTFFFSLETHELLWLDKLGYLAELRLKQADIVGNVSVGRLGLGTITSTRC